jgi:general secretion pathway protein K
VKLSLQRSHASRDRRGIALVIVLISIFVLCILAGGFAYSMKVETKLARNANSESELEWLGRSAVECARWELAQQLAIPQEQYDSLNQVWAGGAGGVGTSNSPLADFKHELKSLNGQATWKIIDLERKVNINIANETVLRQALLVAGVDTADMTPIVGSILDWIGRDSAPHLQGAKSDYYHALNPPYDAKNGPIDTLSELLLVKAITPELYWAGVASEHPPGAFQPRTGRFGSSEPQLAPPVGLVELFTPLSNGKININTASAEVLQCLPGIDKTIAEAIVGGRSGEEDGSGLLGPYRNTGDLHRVPEIPLGLINLINQYTTVRSSTFEVTVDAGVNSYHRTFIAVLGRASIRDVQVLSFYWK